MLRSYFTVCPKITQLFNSSCKNISDFVSVFFNHPSRQSDKQINTLLSSPLCLWEENPPTEWKGLGVQGWPAHSDPDATKRRVAVTHRHFSLHRASLHNESPLLFRAGDHTEALWAQAATVSPSRFWCWIDSVLFGLHLAAPVLQYVYLWACAGWHTVLFCVLFKASCGNYVYSSGAVGSWPATRYKWCWGAVLFLTASLSEDPFVYLQSSLRSSLFIQRGGGLLETCGWLAWGSECAASSWMIKI